MFPGDSAYTSMTGRLNQNSCSVISTTTLDCFLYYCPSSSLLVCTPGYCADWTAKSCPRSFPGCLPMVDMQNWAVGLYPWKATSQKKRPTEINVGRSLGNGTGIFTYSASLLLKLTSFYWKIIWQDSDLCKLNSSPGNSKYIFLCVWKSSNRKKKRTLLKSFACKQDYKVL